MVSSVVAHLCSSTAVTGQWGSPAGLCPREGTSPLSYEAWCWLPLPRCQPPRFTHWRPLKPGPRSTQNSRRSGSNGRDGRGGQLGWRTWHLGEWERSVRETLVVSSPCHTWRISKSSSGEKHCLGAEWSWLRKLWISGSWTAGLGPRGPQGM